jgi:hypothetical protein
MNRTRLLLPVIIVAVLAAFLTACDTPDTGLTVVYRCEGTASEASVTYTGSDGEAISEEVTLPWEQETTRSGNLFGFGLEAVSSADGGVSCTMLLDDEQVATESDERSLSMQAEYTFSGGLREVNVTTSTGSDEPTTEFDLEGAAFILENQSQLDICEIYITDDLAAGWGENLLPPGGQVPVAGSFPLDEVPSEEDNVLLVDCEGRVVGVSGGYGLQLEEESLRATNLGRTRPTIIANQLEAEICSVRISTNDEDFSPNMLTEDDAIPGGELRLFRIPVGVWALQVESCDGQELLVENITLQPDVGYALNVSPTSMLAGRTDASGNLITLTVYNGGSPPICGVYVASSDEDEDWGPNRIEGEGPIEEGENITIYDVENGILDLKLQGCEGEIVNFSLDTDFFALTGEQGPNIPYTTSATPSITVDNQTDAEVCVLQFSRPERDFSRDLLTDPIPAGEARAITLVEGELNLRAETCEGEEYILPTQDVAPGYTWEISQEAVDAAQQEEEDGS